MYILKKSFGKMKKGSIVFLVFCLFFYSILPAGLSVASAQVNAYEEGDLLFSRALEWLGNEQQPTGEWDGDFAYSVRNTTKVLGTLKKFGEFKPDAIRDYELVSSKATEWLEKQTLSSLDLQARAFPFISDVTIQEQLSSSLLEAQNQDGGWGIAAGYESTVLDTMIVLEALLTSEETVDQKVINAAFRFLLNNQKGDGSWSYTSNEGDIYLTSNVANLLIDYTLEGELLKNELRQSIYNSSHYLFNLLDEEGYWGLEKDTLPHTLNAYFVLLRTIGPVEINTLAEDLISIQDKNGSWYDDVYITALAVEKLSIASHLIGSINDITIFKLAEEGDVIDARLKTNNFGAYDIVYADFTFESSSDDVRKIAYVKMPDDSLLAMEEEGDFFFWRTLHYAPGKYEVIVHIQDTKTGIILDTAKNTFSISPTFGLEVVPVTTPEKAVVSEAISVDTRLYVHQFANVEAELEIVTEVFNQEGETVATSNFPHLLKPEQRTDVIPLVTFVPDVSKEQTYTIEARIFHEGVVVTERSIEFDVVIPKPIGIEIEQTIQKSWVYPGEDYVPISYELKGVGSFDSISRKPADFVLVIDNSGSMEWGNQDGVVEKPNRLDYALEASRSIVNLISDFDRMAHIQFAGTVWVQQHFTSDKDALLRSIDNTPRSPWNGTAIGLALRDTNNMIVNHGAAGHEPVVLLMSDGDDNRWTTTSILQEARRSANLGIVVHTVGLGSGADQAILQSIAEITGGTYVFSPTMEELEEVMVGIGDTIFNLSGKDIVLSTNIPEPNVRVNLEGTHPLPVITENEDGSKTLTWSYDSILRDERKQIELELLTSSLDQNSVITLTQDTTLTYEGADQTRRTAELPALNVDVSGMFGLELNLSRKELTSNKDLDIAVTISNYSSDEKQVTARVEIVDEAGDVLTTIEEYTVNNLMPQKNDDRTVTWNTNKFYSGYYDIQVTLLVDGEEVQRYKEPFTIMVDGGIEITSSTSQQEYLPGEFVNASSIVKNKSSNTNYDVLSVMHSILNEAGELVYEELHSLAYLGFGQSKSVSLSWDSVQTPAGTYSLHTKVYNESELLAEDMTGFSVLSSADSGVGLEGLLNFESRNYYIGELVPIDYHVVNNGNATVENGELQIVIVDPIQQSKLETRGFDFKLEVLADIEGSEVFDTSTLSEGTYLVLLQVILEDGTVRLLSTDSFDVSTGLGVNVEFSNETRALIWAENAEPYTKVFEALDIRGDYYNVVHNEKSFINELRSNKYNVFILLDSQNPFTELYHHELIAKLHEGHGLFIHPKFNMANLKIYRLTGVNIVEKKNIQNGKLVFEGLEGFPVNYHGQVDSLRLTVGTEIAKIQSNASYPALVINDYGNGKAIQFAIDIENLIDTEIQTLFGHALDLVTPEKRSSYYSGEVIMVNVTVEAIGGSLDTMIEHSLPEGMTVIDSIDFKMLNKNVQWKGVISPEEPMSLRYLASVPNQKGAYEITIKKGIYHDNDYSQLQNEVFSFEVEKGLLQLIEDAIEALFESDKYLGEGEIEQLRVRLERDSETLPITLSELEEVIDELVKALQLLEKDNGMNNQRLKLERLLSFYQNEWFKKGVLGDAE